MEGVQVDLEKLIEWGSFDTKQDYLDLINRYNYHTLSGRMVPKIFNHVFLFNSSKTLGTYIKFGLDVH